MKHIKLFEAYYDKKDSLFELITFTQAVEFNASHKHIDFTDEEIDDVNEIF
jgi:hypothetical protein